MRVRDGVRVGVPLGERRDDDLGKCEFRRSAPGTSFGLVGPYDDQTVVPEGLRGFDQRHDFRQEIVAERDLLLVGPGEAERDILKKAAAYFARESNEVRLHFEAPFRLAGGMALRSIRRIEV